MKRGRYVNGNIAWASLVREHVGTVVANVTTVSTYPIWHWGPGQQLYWHCTLVMFYVLLNTRKIRPNKQLALARQMRRNCDFIKLANGTDITYLSKQGVHYSIDHLDHMLLFPLHLAYSPRCRCK